MIWNKRVEASPAPLRVLFVTGAPDVPRMRRWLGVLAATLKGDGNVLVVACPDGSLSEDALVEDDAGQLGYVYVAIRGWSDLAGWFQWVTLLRRLRPHSVQLAADLDAGAAIRLALATRLAGTSALLVEARERPVASQRARLAGGLGPRLLYRMLATLVLCGDALQAAALIQTHHIAPAHISLVREAAEPGQRQRRAARQARKGRGARPDSDSAAARARHLQALYQLLRGPDMSEPAPLRAPVRAPVPASGPRPVRASQPPAPVPVPTAAAARVWRPSGAPRLAGLAGQGIEPAATSGRALVLNSSSARMSRVMHGTEAR